MKEILPVWERTLLDSTLFGNELAKVDQQSWTDPVIDFTLAKEREKVLQEKIKKEAVKQAKKKQRQLTEWLIVAD